MDLTKYDFKHSHLRQKVFFEYLENELLRDYSASRLLMNAPALANAKYDTEKLSEKLNSQHVDLLKTVPYISSKMAKGNTSTSEKESLVAEYHEYIIREFGEEKYQELVKNGSI